MPFVVRVIRGGDYRPAHGVKVHLGFTSTFDGNSFLEYTDAAGNAVFDKPERGVVEIRVEGVSYGIYDYTADGALTIMVDMIDEDDWPDN